LGHFLLTKLLLDNLIRNKARVVTVSSKAQFNLKKFDLDTINIKVFKTAPDIFVPNAFRPGGSRNNVLRPIPVGIATLDYFVVYNRWGQMVFQSHSPESGWDGTVAGKPQDAGAFVWMARGRDYTGRTVMRKGTAILLR